jgi:hypothetical protein
MQGRIPSYCRSDVCQPRPWLTFPVRATGGTVCACVRRRSNALALTLSILLQQGQELLNDARRIVQTFLPVVPLNHPHPIGLEKPVAAVVKGSARMKGAIDFQDAPLALATHQEVRFFGDAVVACAQASQAVR